MHDEVPGVPPGHLLDVCRRQRRGAVGHGAERDERVAAGGQPGQLTEPRAGAALAASPGGCQRREHTEYVSGTGLRREMNTKHGLIRTHLLSASGLGLICCRTYTKSMMSDGIIHPFN